MSAAVTAPELRTVRSEHEFLALEGQWDRLVSALERPTPFLLHAWCTEWLRSNSNAFQLAVEIAVADGQLVGALPIVTQRWRGFTVAKFIGGAGTVFADALVDPEVDVPGAVVSALVDRAARGPIDFASLQNLPQGSNLAATLGPDRLWLQPHQTTARWRLEGGWDDAYRARTSSRYRNLYHRRRRQLEKLGQLELRIARSPDDLEEALEEAFRLHALRWRGRPDRSGFASERGKAFHRALVRRLAASGVPRITTLRIDGRVIAFLYALIVRDTMFVFRLAFDPDFGRFSPGAVTNLAAMQDAAREGVAVIDFLPGEERYKNELANDVQDVYLGIGLPQGARGRAGMALAVGSRRVRSRLKRIGPLSEAHATLLRLRSRGQRG